MSLSRVKFGLFNAATGGATGLMGAGLVNFIARTLKFSTFSSYDAAIVLTVGSLIYGCVVSDANGENRVKNAASMDHFFQRAHSLRANTVMFHAANGNIEQVDKALKGGEIKEKIFIRDFLFSTFENVVAGTIGFGVLMLLSSSSISYFQMLESATAASVVSSSFKSFLY